MTADQAEIFRDASAQRRNVLVVGGNRKDDARQRGPRPDRVILIEDTREGSQLIMHVSGDECREKFMIVGGAILLTRSNGSRHGDPFIFGLASAPRREQTDQPRPAVE